MGRGAVDVLGVDTDPRGGERGDDHPFGVREGDKRRLARANHDWLPRLGGFDPRDPSAEMLVKQPPTQRGPELAPDAEWFGVRRFDIRDVHEEGHAAIVAATS